MTTRYEIVNFKSVRTGDTLIRFVAGKPAPIGKVIVIQPQPKGAIVLVTDEGHRLMGQPFDMLMRGKGN